VFFTFGSGTFNLNIEVVSDKKTCMYLLSPNSQEVKTKFYEIKRLPAVPNRETDNFELVKKAWIYLNERLIPRRGRQNKKSRRS